MSAEGEQSEVQPWEAAPPAADPGGGEGAPVPNLCPRGRRWRRRALLLALVLPVFGLAYYYAFCNLPRRSEAWLAREIDVSIDQGLTYLYETGAFVKHIKQGGESPIHHWFLEKVLACEDHPGLRAQMLRAREVNQHDWQWRLFASLPGWPPQTYSPAGKARINYGLLNSTRNPCSVWLGYALYSDWATLREEDYEKLFRDPSKLDGTYELAHALVVYLWLQQPGAGAGAGISRRTVDRAGQPGPVSPAGLGSVHGRHVQRAAGVLAVYGGRS